MGHIERLWVKRFAGGPMDPVNTMDLIADKGIAGNADQGGWRHVTVISAERWARVQADLGTDVDPVLRRANVLVSGVDLANSIGQTLRLGAVELEIRGETRPCRLMEESHPGLQAALDADWGGGAFGVVRVGGTVNLGDPVALLDAADVPA